MHDVIRIFHRATPHFSQRATQTVSGPKQCSSSLVVYGLWFVERDLSMLLVISAPKLQTCESACTVMREPNMSRYAQRGRNHLTTILVGVQRVTTYRKTLQYQHHVLDASS
jgi:hypothetical protein